MGETRFMTPITKECDDFVQPCCNKKLLRGSIFWVDLDCKDVRGSEQAGVRPCIILKDYVELDTAQFVSIVPLTTQLKALHLPTHALIYSTPKNGLKQKSVALAEQVQGIDVSRIKEPIGTLDDEDYANVIQAVRNSVQL